MRERGERTGMRAELQNDPHGLFPQRRLLDHQLSQTAQGYSPRGSVLPRAQGLQGGDDLERHLGEIEEEADDGGARESSQVGVEKLQDGGSITRCLQDSKSQLGCEVWCLRPRGTHSSGVVVREQGVVVPLLVQPQGCELASVETMKSLSEGRPVRVDGGKPTLGRSPQEQRKSQLHAGRRVGLPGLPETRTPRRSIVRA